MEDLTGKQLGPYQVIEPLGEGGMAGVFKAFQPGIMRNVALKVLPRYYANDPEFVGRFRQEAKILANLQHPHILPVFDYGESDGYTYIAMPFLQNGDLTRLLKGQPLPLPQVRRIISQLGDALDYAHQQGLVHRDVKPNNVLLDERGNCLLSDFGITKIIEGTSKFTVTGGIVGTPDYMSPEQGMGRKLDGRSDIYALGIMLYQMVTGRVPYKADTPMAVLFKHVTDPLPLPRKLNPALPEAVEQVVLKALAKQPEDRFATAGEMVQAIQRAIPEATSSDPVSEAPEPPPSIIPPRQSVVAPVASPAPHPAPLPQTPPPVETNFRLMGVAGLLAIAVVAFLCAVAGFIIWMGRPTPSIDTASATNTVAPAASTSPAAAATPVVVVVSTSANLPSATNSPLPPTVAVTAVRAESISLPTFTASPSPSPTLVPSDTPSATPPATFTPTVTPTATPSPLPPVQLGQNCSRTPANEFAAAWPAYRAQLGCPINDVQVIPILAEEEFQGANLFWRSDADQIYIIYDRDKNSGATLLTGKWQTNPDWKWDGSYPDGVGLTPPPGLVEPKRGFGWLWRTHLGGADGPLGWALDKEYGFDNTGKSQLFEQGIMFKGSNPKIHVLLNNGSFYAQ